jgi:hypothetical protein
MSSISNHIELIPKLPAVRAYYHYLYLDHCVVECLERAKLQHSVADLYVGDCGIIKLIFFFVL